MSPLPAPAQTRHLEAPAELDAAAGVLARAFLDDPGFDFTFGDAPGRLERLLWLSRCFIDYTRRARGTVEAVGPSPRGVMLWLDVGARSVLSTPGMIRAGMYASPWRMGPAALLRMMRMGARLDRLHAEALDRPHRYVFYLGVDPEHQRQGLGRSLLGPRVREALAQGLPLYLDTLKERNVAFYRALGFEVVRELPPGPDGPRAWSMVHPVR